MFLMNKNFLVSRKIKNIMYEKMNTLRKFNFIKKKKKKDDIYSILYVI